MTTVLPDVANKSSDLSTQNDAAEVASEARIEEVDHSAGVIGNNQSAVEKQPKLKKPKSKRHIVAMLEPELANASADSKSVNAAPYDNVDLATEFCATVAPSIDSNASVSLNVGL
jgi:hypothetical protein